MWVISPLELNGGNDFSNSSGKELKTSTIAGTLYY
jgi:hypothetical protein